MKTYLFICADETETKVKLSEKLDDFKDFCHYTELSDWEEHKKYINKILDKSNIYVFNGNDVHYYIIIHPCWDDECDEKIELKVENGV